MPKIRSREALARHKEATRRTAHPYPPKGGAKADLRVIACDGCWCGGPYSHDWPGKTDGAPHPR